MVLMLVCTAIPISAVMVKQRVDVETISLSTVHKRKVVGMWGIGIDPEPVGNLKGFYFPAKSVFVGKIFYQDVGYYIGARLNDGAFTGYILYNGNQVPIHGIYVVTSGTITGVWHCHGHSGWLVGQLQ